MLVIKKKNVKISAVLSLLLIIDYLARYTLKHQGRIQGGAEPAPAPPLGGPAMGRPRAAGPSGRQVETNFSNKAYKKISLASLADFIKLDVFR